MSVRPVGLEGVVADRLDRGEVERLGAVALGTAAVHPAEKVGLAGARGTGTGAAELVERVVRFVAVLPDDDEQITDSLI